MDCINSVVVSKCVGSFSDSRGYVAVAVSPLNSDWLQIELSGKEEYDLDLSSSPWSVLDTSFPEGSKRLDLLSTPVSRELARQCAYIDNERIQVYIAPIVGRKLYFTEQIIEWLRQQGPVIDDAVSTGNRNIGKLLQLDGDDHRAIMEAMLYEILFPTAVNGRIAAWIKAGCRENCEDIRSTT